MLWFHFLSWSWHPGNIYIYFNLLGPAFPPHPFSIEAVWVSSCFSHDQFFVTPWTVASRLLGFSRQEHWSGLPFPTPRDLSDPGIEPTSLKSPALTDRFFITIATWGALDCYLASLCLCSLMHIYLMALLQRFWNICKKTGSTTLKRKF